MVILTLVFLVLSMSARVRLTPGVSDYDRNGNLIEPERFKFRERGSKSHPSGLGYQTTRNGAVMRTNQPTGYAVDVRMYNDDPDYAWVYVSGGPDDVAIVEKMPCDEVKAFISKYTGRS